MNDYPAWLSKLVLPRMGPGEIRTMMSMQDQDFFQLDYKDLKYLMRKAKASKDYKKKAIYMFKKLGDESDFELPGENFDRISWRVDVMEDSKSTKGKGKGKSGEDDEDEDDEDEDDEE